MSEGVLRRSVYISGGCAERASCSLDHVFGLVVVRWCLRQSRLVARDLGQARVRLRFYRLTMPFRPVDPLLCAHVSFSVTEKTDSP